jgi:hypothetical protein
VINDFDGLYADLRARFPDADADDLIDMIEATEDIVLNRFVGDRLQVRSVLRGDPPGLTARLEGALVEHRLSASGRRLDAFRRVAESRSR